MYREFAVCLIYCLLVKEVYSRSIQSVCNVKAINLYILESFRLHKQAKSLSNQCVEEYKKLKINENYCIGNSIQGLKGTLERETEISGSGEIIEDNRGCALSFKIELEEGNHKVLGGDLSLYKLPPNDDEDGLTLAITVYYTDSSGVIYVVAMDTINTKAEQGWKVFEINDYAQDLQYGEYRTTLSVSIKTDKTLSCEEMQSYFIFSCSAPKTSNDVPSYYNLMPMLTLFTETKKTILSKNLEGRKRRKVSTTTHCRLEPHFIKLSDIRVLSVDHHVIEDSHINIGACVPVTANKNYAELDATSNHGWLHYQLSGDMYRSLCTPTITQDLMYVVEEKRTGTFTSQILSDAVAIQC